VRVPTAEYRKVGDRYADLIQEALDNLGLEYQDVQFVTPDDDPAATPVRRWRAYGAHRAAVPLPARSGKLASTGTGRRNSIPLTPSMPS